MGHAPMSFCRVNAQAQPDTGRPQYQRSQLKLRSDACGGTAASLTRCCVRVPVAAMLWLLALLEHL